MKANLQWQKAEQLLPEDRGRSKGQKGRWQRDRKTFGSDGCLVTLILVMASQVYTYVKTDQIVHLQYVNILHINYTSIKLFLRRHFWHMAVHSLFREGPTLSTLAQCGFLTMVSQPELELRLPGSCLSKHLFSFLICHVAEGDDQATSVEGAWRLG